MHGKELFGVLVLGKWGKSGSGVLGCEFWVLGVGFWVLGAGEVRQIGKWGFGFFIKKTRSSP
jgi:hypothetical protein